MARKKRRSHLRGRGRTAQQRKMGTCARRCKGKTARGFRSCMRGCLKK